MIKRLGLRRLGIFVAVLILLLDQVSKGWILYLFDLPSKGSVKVLSFFDLSMVWNTGVSFGLFSSQSWVGRLILVGVSLIVVGFLVKFLFEADRRLFALALGLVIGGAVGNAIDRLIHGAVVDFFDFSGLGFPWVFNVADSAISIGVVLLVYDTIFAKEDVSRS